MIRYQTLFRCSGILTLFCAICGSSCVVSAQLHTLLNTDAVLDELDLDSDQRAVVKPLYEKYAKAEKKEFLNISGGVTFTALSTSQQEELRPRFAEAMSKLDAMAAQEMAEVLSTEQLERLAQLRFQALGAAGLVSGKLNTALGITKEESDQFTPTVVEFQKGFVETYKAELEGKTREEVERFHKTKLIEAILSTLEPEKQELYYKLLGEPADLPQIRSMR